MKSHPFRAGHTRDESGQALLISLMALSVVAALTGTAILRTSGAARIAARATDYAEVERVSDGIIEYAYGAWKGTVQQKDRALTAGEAKDVAGSAPSFPGTTAVKALTIQPTNAYGAPVELESNQGNQDPLALKPARILTYIEHYPGWKGFTYNYIATVTMQHTGTPNGPIAGTRRYFQYTQVPLFQAMYFYEHNLEIYRPAPMIVGGLVHTNSKLFLSGSKDQSGAEITFQGNVSYVTGATSTEPPLGGPAWAGLNQTDARANMETPTYSNGGESAQLSRVDRYEPLGKKPASVLNSTDSNPNNDSMRELIELPVAGKEDPPEIAKRRLSTKAGIIMNISGSSTMTISVTTQNGTSLTADQITALKAAVVGKTTVYDQREAKNVDIVNIDVSKATPVLNNASGFNGVLYVYDSTPETSSDKEPRTLRLQKGGILPNDGLTIASPNPVYVQGDYNTGTTNNPDSVPANSSGNPNNTSSPVVAGYVRKPAAIIADAVMLLSNAWSDSKASSDVSSRVASNTTYNTAIMAGFMPSGWQPTSGSAYGYSGGANNYPRFLETWTGKSCTYFGSMVELFESKVFTGEWDTGVIYRPPNRRWNYDPNFADNPPPGSVDAVVMSRGTWARL